jgi:carboxyl-terminal processing protease
MLKSLDPHSAYLSPEGFTDLREAISGEYGGIGIEVSYRDEFVTVISPIADTPGEAAGLEPNDRIIGVDGDSMLGAGMDEAISRMRGAAGEPVILTISREGMDPFDVHIVREIIEVRAARWNLIEEEIPYLRLTTFHNHTTENAVEGLNDMREALGGELPGLILDLRSNPGGALDQSVFITELFLDGGEVVSARGRDPRDTQRYNAQSGDLLDDAPIVVLINSGSASASEIVTGALKDRERATIVGMRSFGKGSVQSIIPLDNGGGLRLTTARYYTPAGTSIQGTGIAPDIAISHRRFEEDAPNLRTESSLDNSLVNESGEEREMLDITEIEMPPEDWEEGEDYQLHRAVQILRGMMIGEQASL